MNENDIEELDFFERGIALVVANLDYGKEILTDLDYQKVNVLADLVTEFEEVEDYQKWDELNTQLIAFNEELFSNEVFLTNNELYTLLQEPVHLNKYLKLLLISSNYQDIPTPEIEVFLKDNFHTIIEKVLNIPKIEQYLNSETLSICKILAKETDNQDLIEGFGIVFLYANNHFVKLVGTYLTIFDLLTEADAILSYLFFLNEPEE